MLGLFSRFKFPFTFTLGITETLEITWLNSLTFTDASWRQFVEHLYIGISTRIIPWPETVSGSQIWPWNHINFPQNPKSGNGRLTQNCRGWPEFRHPLNGLSIKTYSENQMLTKEIERRKLLVKHFNWKILLCDPLICILSLTIVFVWARPISLFMHITWEMLKCIFRSDLFAKFSFRYFGMLIWWFIKKWKVCPWSYGK